MLDADGEKRIFCFAGHCVSPITGEDRYLAAPAPGCRVELATGLSCFCSQLAFTPDPSPSPPCSSLHTHNKQTPSECPAATCWKLLAISCNLLHCVLRTLPGSNILDTSGDTFPLWNLDPAESGVTGRVDCKTFTHFSICQTRNGNHHQSQL